MNGEVTDEMLMALADGELDDATARALLARIERDPELGRRHADFVRSAAATRAVFGEVLAETPPAALAAAIRGHGRPAAAAAARRRWNVAGPLPLAAAIALAAGVAGYLVRGPDEVPGREALAALDAAFVALAEAPAGAVVDLPGGARGVVLESYETGIGPCRVAQMRDAGGGVLEAVGCLRAGRWQAELALRSAAPDAARPAEGDGPGPVRAFLDRSGAGPALDPDEEQARIVRGW